MDDTRAGLPPGFFFADELMLSFGRGKGEIWAMTNRLYYGDNLDILRRFDYFPSESVDLIYLDPPFNSNRSYNVLFSDESGLEGLQQHEHQRGREHEPRL